MLNTIMAVPARRSKISLWEKQREDLDPTYMFYHELIMLLQAKKTNPTVIAQEAMTGKILDTIILYFIENAATYHTKLLETQQRLGEHFEANYDWDAQLEMHKARTQKELRNLTTPDLCLLFSELPRLSDYTMALHSILGGKDSEELMQSRFIGALSFTQIDTLFRNHTDPEKRECLDPFIQSKFLTAVGDNIDSEKRECIDLAMQSKFLAARKKASFFSCFSFFSRLFENRIAPKLRTVCGFFARTPHARGSASSDQKPDAASSKSASASSDQKPSVSFSGLPEDCRRKLSLYDIFYNGVITELQRRAKAGEKARKQLHSQLGAGRFSELLSWKREVSSAPAESKGMAAPSSPAGIPETETLVDTPETEVLKDALLYTAAQQVWRFYERLERRRPQEKNETRRPTRSL